MIGFGRRKRHTFMRCIATNGRNVNAADGRRIRRASVRSIAAVAVALSVLSLLALSAGGCKHETPAEKEQKITTDERQAVAAFEQRVRQIVKDPERANEIVAQLSNLQVLVHNLAASMNDERAQLAALNANYAATRADYQTLLARQDAQRDELIRTALAIRQQMAALMTDAEWDELKRERVKTFDAMLARYQS
jgi:hypothetical protein